MRKVSFFSYMINQIFSKPFKYDVLFIIISASNYTEFFNLIIDKNVGHTSQ